MDVSRPWSGSFGHRFNAFLDFRKKLHTTCKTLLAPRSPHDAASNTRSMDHTKRDTSKTHDIQSQHIEQITQNSIRDTQQTTRNTQHAAAAEGTKGMGWGSERMFYKTNHKKYVRREKRHTYNTQQTTNFSQYHTVFTRQT